MSAACLAREAPAVCPEPASSRTTSSRSAASPASSTPNPPAGRAWRRAGVRSDGDGVKRPADDPARVAACGERPIARARASISRAARRVKVSSSTRSGATPSPISHATRAARVVVLPVPAPGEHEQRPARMRGGGALLLVERVQIARCGGFDEHVFGRYVTRRTACTSTFPAHVQPAPSSAAHGPRLRCARRARRRRQGARDRLAVSSGPSPTTRAIRARGRRATRPPARRPVSRTSSPRATRRSTASTSIRRSATRSA